MKLKVRPFGEVLLDLEIVIEEMTGNHDVQLGDILNLVRGYIEVHTPDAIEEYLDGTNPVFYYGPKEERK